MQIRAVDKELFLIVHEHVSVNILCSVQYSSIIATSFDYYKLN